jgi:hypothetical protein
VWLVSCVKFSGNKIMLYPTKKSISVLTLAGFFSILQFTVWVTNSNAQSSEVQQLLRELNSMEGEAGQLIQQMIAEDWQRIYRLSCQGLIQEANQLTKNGDYWATQVNIPHYAARASGNYAASERRYQEYNRRCR